MYNFFDFLYMRLETQDLTGFYRALIESGHDETCQV
jgi:hypothetical protein